MADIVFWIELGHASRPVLLSIVSFIEESVIATDVPVILLKLDGLSEVGTCVHIRQILSPLYFILSRPLSFMYSYLNNRARKR